MLLSEIRANILFFIEGKLRIIMRLWILSIRFSLLDVWNEYFILWSSQFPSWRKYINDKFNEIKKKVFFCDSHNNDSYISKYLSLKIKKNNINKSLYLSLLKIRKHAQLLHFRFLFTARFANYSFVFFINICQYNNS